MPYVNPYQVLSPYLQPSVKTATALLPTFLQHKRWKEETPGREAATKYTQERAKQIEETRQRWTDIMTGGLPGFSKLLPEGVTPETYLKARQIGAISPMSITQPSYQLITAPGEGGKPVQQWVEKGKGGPFPAYQKQALQRKTYDWSDPQGNKWARDYDYDSTTGSWEWSGPARMTQRAKTLEDISAEAAARAKGTETVEQLSPSQMINQMKLEAMQRVQANVANENDLLILGYHKDPVAASLIGQLMDGISMGLVSVEEGGKRRPPNQDEIMGMIRERLDVYQKAINEKYLGPQQAPVDQPNLQDPLGIR